MLLLNSRFSQILMFVIALKLISINTLNKLIFLDYNQNTNEQRSSLTECFQAIVHRIVQPRRRFLKGEQGLEEALEVLRKRITPILPRYRWLLLRTSILHQGCCHRIPLQVPQRQHC